MLYEQILELDKNNPTVINELGDLCLKGDESRRAVSYFLSAASKYRTTGLLNNAVAIYKKILRHDSENLNAHWYLSETRANQGLVVEGESHAVHFLNSSENVSGDIKEIFLKRCQSLFDLFPQSQTILTRLSQIFRMWTMPLEAARADCLLLCMDFAAGKEDESRLAIDELTGKVPEIMNYPEFAKWNSVANPTSTDDSAFADFGSVSLDTDDAGNDMAAVEIPEVPAAETAPAAGLAESFGDVSLDSPAAEAPVANAPEDEASTSPSPIQVKSPQPVLTSPLLDTPVADSGPLLGSSTPAAEELDDDGCFSIDDDSEGDSASFDDLIAEATSEKQFDGPAVDVFIEPTPAGSDAAAEPENDTKVDLLAQMLDEEGPSLVKDSGNEVATISAEIGNLVGDGDDDDADRLYEMGMVYLEMGMFDQACESFETAAADEQYSVRAHEMWGITLQRADRHDEAVQVLTNGLDFAEDGSREHHGLMYHLGMAKEKTGHTEEAIACFRTINDVDPSYLDVGRRLAKLTMV